MKDLYNSELIEKTTTIDKNDIIQVFSENVVCDNLSDGIIVFDKVEIDFYLKKEYLIFIKMYIKFFKIQDLFDEMCRSFENSSISHNKVFYFLDLLNDTMNNITKKYREYIYNGNEEYSKMLAVSVAAFYVFIREFENKYEFYKTNKDIFNYYYNKTCGAVELFIGYEICEFPIDWFI